MSDDARKDNRIERFELRIYRGSAARGEPERTFSGTGADWEDYRVVMLEGFSGSMTLSLESFWNAALETRFENPKLTLTARETIVKFGKVQQLTEKFTVVGEITFNR